MKCYSIVYESYLFAKYVTMRYLIRIVFAGLIVCVSFSVLVDTVFHHRTWTHGALLFSDIIYYLAMALCGIGSICSLVVLSQSRLRRSVGMSLPLVIICITLTAICMQTVSHITYAREKRKPIQIEAIGSGLYKMDGNILSRRDADQRLHRDSKKYGYDRELQFRASPLTEFAQVGNILELSIFSRNRIGLSDTNALLETMLIQLPESLGGPGCNIARVYLTATNCCIHLEYGFKEGQSISGVVEPPDVSRAMIASRTNGLNCRVTLYISPDVTFGAVHKLVKEFGDHGIKLLFFDQTSRMPNSAPHIHEAKKWLIESRGDTHPREGVK